jgi:acyl-CoA synthetase (AMP-forming)/AMP-acid ligase II
VSRHAAQLLSYGDLLREHRRCRPDRIAAVDGDRRLTWTELDERVNRLANVFAPLGVNEHGPVLWLGQNSHRLLECYLAAAKLGAEFCPVNWRQTADELAFVIDDLDPRVVVWQAEEIADAAQAAAKVVTSAATWIQHDEDGPDGYEARLAAASVDDPYLLIDPDRPLLVIYTSAFDGHPRGAMLSHTALMVQDLVMGRLQDISDETVYLNGGPLFHLGTVMGANATFHHGGTNVFVRRSDPELLCRLIEAERCTHGFLPGPTAEAIAEHNAFGADLSSLYPAGAIVNRANPIVTPPSAPWHGRGGSYGQSEVVGLAAFKAIGAPSVGSAGRPSGAAAIRIVDTDAIDVAPGSVGEILVKGPLVMVGYHGHDETERHLDGWHRTRDLGRREFDGSISFIGPALSMIKSAAENIYPAEVEACVRAHPAVVEVCVIGVPDPVWTQNVKAVVVLRDGASATADDIVQHCRERIASYKKPKVVEFVSALPRSASGFVDRSAVDDAHGGGGYPGEGQ